MNDDPNRTTSIFQRIGSRFACDQCGRKFRPRDVILLEEWDRQWLVEFKCSFCRSELLLTVRLNDHKLRLFPLDLTPREWPRFRSRPPIGVNDVVDMTRYMMQYEGDFGEILEDPFESEAEAG